MADKESTAEKMKNPYDEFGAHPDEAHLGAHWFAWGAVIVFLLVGTVLPVWRNAYEIFRGDEGSLPLVEMFRYDAEKDGSLFDHLREIEGRFEDAAFTGPPRRALQAALTATLREGNRKTVIGRQGWLFFKPAIDGLIGYGPLKAEPDTVAKDPTREPWQGPLAAITHFGEQLDSYGVELVLVPIPVKPMIYPEMLGGDGGESPVRHRDAQAFYQKLSESGVQVLDLADEFMAMKMNDGPVFLKQDTHWTPSAMQSSAEQVAEFLKGRPWIAETAGGKGFTVGEAGELSAPGDLVEKLDLPDGSAAFADEVAEGVAEVLGGDDQVVSIYDTSSPVVLLGDSFTNIFSQGDMGWGDDAGFAQHLTRELGMTIDTVAQNGQASTGVRRTLASRPGAAAEMQAKKKVVVWAIAARDLFLSETPAREAQVRWDDVEFSTKAPTAAAGESEEGDSPVKLRAKLTMKSSFANPADVPYPDALYACEYEVLEVLDGSFAEPNLLVFHWAFRARELLPSSNYEEGEERVLSVVPFAQKTKLQSINQANDSFDLDLPQMWEEEVVVTVTESAALPDSPEGEGSKAGAVSRAALVAGIYAALLIVLLTVVARKCALRRVAAES